MQLQACLRHMLIIESRAEEMQTSDNEKKEQNLSFSTLVISHDFKLLAMHQREILIWDDDIKSVFADEIKLLNH